MSWADKVHRERQKQAARDKHTVSCAGIFYSVLAISMDDLGYSENQILEVLQKMDEVYGWNIDFPAYCKDYVGIEVKVE